MYSSENISSEYSKPVIKNPMGKSVAILFALFYFSNPLISQSDTSRNDSAGFSYLSEVAVTGTRTVKRKTETPVIVNILDNTMLSNLNVCNLSEGLKFQPGLRT